MFLHDLEFLLDIISPPAKCSEQKYVITALSLMTLSPLNITLYKAPYNLCYLLYYFDELNLATVVLIADSNCCSVGNDGSYRWF